INCPAKEPYYVKQIDVKNNLLKVCFKKDLLRQNFTIGQINWNFSDLKTIPDIMTKIRYSHKEALSTLTFNKPFGEVVFNKPQKAITPGQAAVFYKDARILGAGIIQ
ncbi:MAG: tRNA 2-thiouridine(34) synthase MnmA, partial [Desulfobacula sp.]|nr:tRNA 2-thiouridine(34) synthase MnmA [Desulfobacula sp.]